MARRGRAEQSGTLAGVGVRRRPRFYEMLVLNQWMLGLFEVNSFGKLAEHLRSPELELLDENNVSRFYHEITNRLFDLGELPKDVLLGYDQNIVRHTQRISEARNEPIRWKYFQYLSLLFAEIYLDRYFRDPEKLRDDLNRHVAEFNRDLPESDRIVPYELSDLRKLALWSATGSGKTLLMHVNILQYRHYLALHGRKDELNRVILLTPNEGLSRQHLEEFGLSKIRADIFAKDRGSLFAGEAIEIIDIHKLREEMGEKTVAIDAFEGNNLVLVDEGHRGSTGFEWKSRRDRLCEDGFSFEYSATFGQAVKASNRKDIEQEYAKCILVDYSYRHFYWDGFGKDYHILNLADDQDDDVRRLYLTACLLAFYQQQRLYGQKEAEFRPFLLEKPLWVFVGGSVNAVRTQAGRKVSDVTDVLLFLAEFVENRTRSIRLIDRLLGGRPGLLDTRGQEIFERSFGYLIRDRLDGQAIYDGILQVLFNAKSPALVHVENLKGTDGEIALRLGEYEPFGVINVGDASRLCKLCEEYGNLVVTDRDFSGSLFSGINTPESTVNLLIGSKKFSEGWNSWRVSTMGLMNIGRAEGSEIIQLFGRGVRLKGFDMSLKRSRHVEGCRPPDDIEILETLNVFGIRADYMRQFKDYLEEEGLPSNEDRIEIVLPVVNGLGIKKLTTLKLPDGLDFKKQAPKPRLDGPPDHILRNPVVLNWYPRIQSEQSRGVRVAGGEAVLDECKLTAEHTAFMDMDGIYFELQGFKNERAWYNLNLSPDVVPSLLQNPDWYTLYIPRQELEFTGFGKVRRWQELAVALLKKYCKRYYLFRKREWEDPNLQYADLREDDPNFIEEYQVQVEQSRDDIISKLNELKERIAQGDFRPFEFQCIEAVWFGQHLYQPLLYLSGNTVVTVTPVALNQGERDFVLDLKGHFESTKPFFADKELYLLRNQSKGRGVGFFEASNFYPDFILWLLHDGKQYVSFVDPKGIRNLEGLNDPKIRFHTTVKELETRLGDPNVVLNSFIVSCTPFRAIEWWATDKAEYEKRNVLFQHDDKATYIGKMLKKIIRSLD